MSVSVDTWNAVADTWDIFEHMGTTGADLTQVGL